MPHHGHAVIKLPARGGQVEFLSICEAHLRLCTRLLSPKCDSLSIYRGSAASLLDFKSTVSVFYPETEESGQTAIAAPLTPARGPGALRASFLPRLAG